MYATRTIALTLMPGIGKGAILKIYENYGRIPKSSTEIRDMMLDLGERYKNIKIPSLEEVKEAMIKANKIAEDSVKNGIKAISIFDKKFPEKLKIIKDPPVILFVKGNEQCIFEDKSIAIIGTRKPTAHGEKVAERLGNLFAERGYVVVSGLANGCDTFGHLGCIKSKGRSIAVLPGGLDKIYPASNKNLAESILEEDGCLVSEYPIGVKPFRNHYVERDRLQSAFSRSVIVIETDVKGGTMHTARFALEQQKVLACYNHPMSLREKSQTKGNRMLIESRGAVAISSPEDIDDLIAIIEESAHNLKNKSVANRIQQKKPKKKEV